MEIKTKYHIRSKIFCSKYLQMVRKSPFWKRILSHFPNRICSVMNRFTHIFGFVVGAFNDKRANFSSNG